MTELWLALIIFLVWVVGVGFGTANSGNFKCASCRKGFDGQNGNGYQPCSCELSGKQNRLNSIPPGPESGASVEDSKADEFNGLTLEVNPKAESEGVPVNCENCHYCFQRFGVPLEPGTLWPSSASRLIVCPTCGNKRCPKASNHHLACTRSNDTGQPGSIYQ